MGIYPLALIDGQDAVALSLKATALLLHGTLNMKVQARTVLQLMKKYFHGDFNGHYHDLHEHQQKAAVKLKDDGGICTILLSAAALYKLLCWGSANGSAVSAELLPHVTSSSFRNKYNLQVHLLSVLHTSLLANRLLCVCRLGLVGLTMSLQPRHCGQYLL